VAAQLREVRRTLEGPADAATFGTAARHYQAYAMFGPAEACYRNAAALAPGDFRWPYLLGVVLQETGRLEESAASLAAALASPDRYYPALLRLAAVQTALGRREEAERTLIPARAHAPGDPALLALDGELALARGDAATAAAMLERALAAEPRADRLRYPLGMAYRALGRREEAAAQLARAGPTGVRARDPLLEEVMALRTGESPFMVEGHQAMRAGDVTAAAAAFARAVEESGGRSVPALVNLAAAEARLGRAEAAIAHLVEVLRLEPGHPAASFNLGVLLLAAGRAREAEPVLAALVARAPGDGDARFEWALALVAVRRFQEAVAALEPLSLAAGQCARLAGILPRADADEPGLAGLRDRVRRCASAAQRGHSSFRSAASNVRRSSLNAASKFAARSCDSANRAK
jgi:tetratricopeptide (TPR) repeat protein